MKKTSTRILSWLLAVCLVFSMIEQAVVYSVGTEEAAPSLQSTGFEAENSFLTQEQYAALGFSLGSAADHDLDPGVHPLQALTEFKNGSITYNDVEYGWSNPQVLAVMLSSPYWNELDYGADMTAAGETSFSISCGTETSTSTEHQLSLKVSITAKTSMEVAGNGFELGCSFSGAMACAEAVQSGKTTETSLEFKAGAKEDHVALIVFPVAVYEYETTVNGKTQYIYVNVQLNPVAHTTTLDAYNSVVRDHNRARGTGAARMTEINMDVIHPGYTAGDPSTYFTSENPIPSRFAVKNGKLFPATATGTLAADQIAGETHVSESWQTVSFGDADTTTGVSLSVGTSSGTTTSSSVILGASVFGGVKVGFDAFGVESETSVSAELSAETGVSVSDTVINSRTVTYSMAFADLPDTSKTGQAMGIATSDYSFRTKLFVWIPAEQGNSVSIAPRFIGAIVEFPDPSKMPLYLPDDLHVSSVSENSVTLSWNNPDFTQSPFKQRKPAEYWVYTVSGGSSSVYAQIASVSADSESITITGLNSGTEYPFALGAADGSRNSAIGPSVTATTLSDGQPIITRQPEDIMASEGGQAILTVEAEPSVEGNPLSYQWYQLEVDKYGTNWTPIIGATDASFNAAYYAQDGLVNSANRFDLNGTVYRCLVTEKHNNGEAVNVASNAVTVSVADIYYIRTYEDLFQIAAAIQNGHKEAAAYHYILANDITFPEDAAWNIPIGSSAVPFTGTFDGKGHTISGLKANVSNISNFGLFGVLKDATVTDLHLANADIYTQNAMVGTLCGRAANSYIANCTASGKVSGYTIWMAAGGLCGVAESGTVIENCINYCSMQTQLNNVGGICGNNSGQIRYCANFGNIRSYNPVDEDFWEHDANAGGITGYNHGTVRSCYNVGTITDEATGYNDTICLGNAAINSYYLYSKATSAGRTAAQFASGQVAWELNNGVTDGTQIWYQNLDNGLTPDRYPTLTDNGRNAVYKVDLENKTYTNTRVNSDGYIEIGTAEELMQFADFVNAGNQDAFAILTADIDMSGITDYVPIGQTALYHKANPAADGDWGYTGIFDGNGHVIRNLTITGSSTDNLSFGLFGTLNGVVRNLGIENFIYTGAGMDSRVGAIAGQLLTGGGIENCYLNGGNINTQVNTVNGVAGGIAGANYGGLIRSCFVNGLTVAAGRAGGIVGDNYGDGNGANGTDRPGTVINCYTSEDSLCNRGTAEDSLANVSAKAFASGEITYLLFESVYSKLWRQGENGLPGFTGDFIYQNTCEGDIFYATTDTDYEAHSLSGVRCKNCGCYDAPTLVTQDNYASLKLDESYIGYYAIRNASHFYWLSERDAERDITGGIVLIGNVILSNSAEPWTPINVNGNFTFDGRGHTLTLKLDFGTEQRGGYLGLFEVFNYATAKDLILRGSVTGCTTSHMGGLSASMYRSTVSGVVSYVSVTNTCTTSGSAGGIAGYFGGQHSGSLHSLIENCAVYADITGYHAGGIVGYGWAGWQYYDIKNAAYFGNVTGIGHQGAIIGYHANNQTANPCTFTNIYYCETDNLGFSGGGSTNYTLGDDVTAKTRPQFSSGEVAYLLNGGAADGTQVWYQNLDNGELPNLYPQITSTGSNTVYPILNAAETEIRGYSNYQHDSKTSVIQRVDLRVYHRVMEEDGGISPNSKTVYGYGFVNNEQKTITVFTSTTTGYIGLLLNQGSDGAVGQITLNGYKWSDKTSQEILASGNEEDIYVDARGCIFIRIPENPSTIPKLTLTYTNKKTSDYVPTEYKLIITVVDLSMFQMIGATWTDQLSPEDPDYETIYGEAEGTPDDGGSESTPGDGSSEGTPGDSGSEGTPGDGTPEGPPDTGDTNRVGLWLVLAFVSLMIVIIAYKKRTAYSY